MYQSDWDAFTSRAFTSSVSTVPVSTHRFKNDEAHSCWVAGKVNQRCQCRVHKFSLNAGRIFFLVYFLPQQGSHNKHTLMNDTFRLWVGQSSTGSTPGKTDNTSSCCWLERKVNRQRIFFRTPYPLVQSHFHVKPLSVTGVPNLLKYIIIRWRYVTWRYVVI